MRSKSISVDKASAKSIKDHGNSIGRISKENKESYQ